MARLETAETDGARAVVVELEKRINALIEQRGYGMTYIASDLEALLDGLRSPTAPPEEPPTTPSESVDGRAKAFVRDTFGFDRSTKHVRLYSDFYPNGTYVAGWGEAPLTDRIARYIKAEIERQTPAIEQAAVKEAFAELSLECDDKMPVEQWQAVVFAMQTVKARRSGGSK